MLNDGILYRVSKALCTNSKCHQYVVPGPIKAAWSPQPCWSPESIQKSYAGQTPKPANKEPLESIRSKPLQLVCINFLSAEDANKIVDVLVLTDHFTRMAQAFLCTNQSAKQVAKVPWDKFFCVFGILERIHSDHRATFKSQLISKMLKVSGIRKSHTIPYHPMGKGSVEWFNRTD